MIDDNLTDVPDNADYDGEEAWQGTPEEQLQYKKWFLDGVPADSRLFFDDYVAVESGSYNVDEGVFVWKPDGEHFLAYYVTSVTSPTKTYHLILGTEDCLGQVYPKTH